MSRFDSYLFNSALILLLLGLVMVFSTTIPFAVKTGDPFFYFWRQSTFALIGILSCVALFQIPIQTWEKWSVALLFIGILLLVATLLFGHEVKGSVRWLNFGKFSLQPSEFMKIFIVLFMAGYLIRRNAEVKESISGFIKPMAILVILSILLLLEPDYGATVVLFGTVLGMLFLGGVPTRQFILWLALVGAVLFVVLLISPYRLHRLMAFVDPWSDPFNKGFQLTQSLIAIGRGGWFGVGLGSSVQKLDYLPETHTDFIFAILAEELGLIGSLTVILLYGIIIWRSFVIAQTAVQLKHNYAAWLSYGLGLTLAVQVSINLGVNMGLLPTKGLTLPLMSYGGSSLLASLLMIMLLLRVDFENKLLNK
jgi:cell division protein FtsW